MSSSERRELLAKATRDIILTEGEKAATVRGITKKAGMPLSSFHYVYESRESAVRDVWPLLRSDDSYFAVPESVPEGTTPEDLMVAMAVGWFQEAAHNWLQELGELELIVHSLRTEELRHLPREFHSDYESRLCVTIEQGTQVLGLRPVIPVRQIAQMILVVTDGAAKAMIMRPEEFQLEVLLPPLFYGFNRFFEPIDAN